MAESYNVIEQHDTPKEFGKDKKGIAAKWQSEIQVYKKAFDSWHNRGDTVLARYGDTQGWEGALGSKPAARFNILWSNVQTIKPALYSQCPTPEVTRRYRDADPIGRAAAEILERGCDYSVEPEKFDPVMEASVLDYLLPGRGQVWVRYKADIVQTEEGEQLAGEDVLVEHIYWKDFGHTTARKWEEVRGVWRRAYLRRDELVQRFGSKVGKKIPLDYAPKELENELDEYRGIKNETYKKATIYEVWDKENAQCLWISMHHPEVLDQKKPLLNLQGFFPCPKPLLTTTLGNGLMPVPDFCQYQDQARQLDDIASRIDVLIAAVKVAGVYAANCEEIKTLLSRGTDNRLVPVKNWPQFSQAGGLKGSVDWWPLDQVLQGLATLYDGFDRIKNQIYEITGVSDIIRGYSAPVETATAVQTKGQFASIRIRDRQDDIQRFARDTIAIVGEVIAERFQPETIWQMCGGEALPDDVKMNFGPAMELLKNDKLRGFRIDIETDSTMSLDQDLERRARAEYLGSTGQFIQQALPMIQMNPALMPYAIESLKFGAQGFRTGRRMESALETALQQMQQAAQEAQQNPQPPPPDPKMMEVQMKGQMEQAKMQMEQAKMQADMQQKQAEFGLKQHEMEMDMAEQQGEMQLKQQEFALKQQELALKQADLELKTKDIEAKIMMAREENQKDIIIAQLEGELQRLNDIRDHAPKVKKAVMSRNPETGNLEGEMIEH